MNSSALRWSMFCLAPLLLFAAATDRQPAEDPQPTTADSTPAHSRDPAKTALKVQYLEIVTPAVAETCDALARAHGVEFSDPIPALGNARTAKLKDGGRIGVRAPLRKSERPMVRPYMLVDDIKSAVKAVTAAGAKLAMPPMAIPNQGTFAIYILGGIEHGLWQTP